MSYNLSTNLETHKNSLVFYDKYNAENNSCILMHIFLIHVLYISSKPTLQHVSESLLYWCFYLEQSKTKIALIGMELINIHVNDTAQSIRFCK